MVLLHPNPMDHSSWLYQTAHFATWFHCIAIDLPGYGRSPAAAAGVSMAQIAAACWDAVDDAGRSDSPVVLVGCSIGSELVQYMYRQRPIEVGGMVLSGTGWSPTKDFCLERIEEYRRKGMGFRREHALRGFSAEFARSELGQWFADMFQQRNEEEGVESILALYHAMHAPLTFHDEIDVPVLILSGELDVEHQNAFALRDRLPNAEVVTIDGAGHACQVEKPWVFNAHARAFLVSKGLSPV
jgi:pimeloyl-ACP methyl ester carboxylesterase